MSYPPYGQNPYGQNPYGQPQNQPSGPWQGAGGQQPQQPGWGQQPAQWGQQRPQQPGWDQGPQGGQGWNQPNPNLPVTEGPNQRPGSQPSAQQPGGPAQPVPPTPVPEPEKRRAQMITRDVLVVTTETLPGHEVQEVLGEVIGVITRPRDMRPSPDMSVILTETRQDAVSVMVEMAVEAGADAVLGLRFDGGKINEGASEVTAYGTAVKLVKPATRAAEDEKSEVSEEQEGESDAPAHENPFVSF